MPLVPAICTQCNSAIQVDSEKDAATCISCNTAFIVEKAINNYLVNGQSFDDLVSNANVFIELGEFDKAQRIFDDITNRHPSKAVGWWGLLQCLTLNFTDLQSDKQSSATLYYERAIKFATEEEREKFAETFENFILLQKEQQNAFAIAQETRISATNKIVSSITALEKQRMIKRIAYSKKSPSFIVPIIVSVLLAIVIHFAILAVAILFLVLHIHRKQAKKRLLMEVMKVDSEISVLKNQLDNL